MCEFLCSAQFNPDGDLLVSSSYLTFQHWLGFVTRVSAEQLASPQQHDWQAPFMPSASGKHFDTGVCDARWLSADRFVVGTENGQLAVVATQSATNSSTPPANDVNGSGEDSSSALVSRPPSYELKFTRQEHDHMVLCVDAAYGSSLAISGSHDAKIKVWDVEQELSTRTYAVHEYTVCSLALSPHDSQMFLSCSEDGRALLWDRRKVKPAFALKHELSGHPSACSWSPVNANSVAFGSETGMLGVYDLRLVADASSSSDDNTSRRQATTSTFNILGNKVHTRYVRRVCFHPTDGTLLATASEDCTSSVQRIAAPSVLSDAHLDAIYSYKHNDYVTDVSWHPTRRNELVSCSWDGRLRSHQLNEN